MCAIVTVWRVSNRTVWETPNFAGKLVGRLKNRRSRFYLVGFGNSSNSGAARGLLIGSHELGDSWEAGFSGVRIREVFQLTKQLKAAVMKLQEALG